MVRGSRTAWLIAQSLRHAARSRMVLRWVTGGLANRIESRASTTIRDLQLSEEKFVRQLLGVACRNASLPLVSHDWRSA